MKNFVYILLLITSFSIEGMESTAQVPNLNGKSSYSASSDSLRLLFSTCLDSCRVSKYYFGRLYSGIRGKKFNINYEDLTEHEKTRIKLLAFGEFEQWELDKLVNEETEKEEIEKIIQEDKVIKTLSDSNEIANRKKEIANWTISKRQKERIEHEWSNEYIVELIIQSEWKQCIPLLEDLYRKDKKSRCYHYGYEYIEYILAKKYHIEPYLSDCIKRYGYDEKTQDVRDFKRLVLIGTPAALYEITKTFRSKAKDCNPWHSTPEYIRNRNIIEFANTVEGFPITSFGKSCFDFTQEKLEENINTTIDDIAEGYHDYIYNEIEKNIDKIMQWVEENKDSLHLQKQIKEPWRYTDND